MRRPRRCSSRAILQHYPRSEKAARSLGGWIQSKPGRSASRFRQARNSASLSKRTGKLASNGPTPNSKTPRPPRKRRPKKGLQSGARSRNRHRDRSALRHGRRRLGLRGHRDGCAPHGDACGGPRRGTTTECRYLGPCRPDVTLRVRAVGALRRPAWQELRECAGAFKAGARLLPLRAVRGGLLSARPGTGLGGWLALSGRVAHGRTGGRHGQL